MKLKTIIGKNIRTHRKDLGLTLEKAAEKIDISTKYLSEIERGIKEPSLSTIEKIAKAYKLSPLHLFFDESDYDIDIELHKFSKSCGKEKMKKILHMIRILDSNGYFE